MNMRAERFFPELKMDGLSGLVAALREKLEAAQTLVMRPNEHGIYAASASQGEEAASGYQNAWIRDNAMVVFAVCARRCGIGNANGAWAATFLKTQAEKMERIIAKPKRKEEVNGK